MFALGDVLTHFSRERWVEGVVEVCAQALLSPLAIHIW
jgi:hypothetical protein